MLINILTAQNKPLYTALRNDWAMINNALYQYVTRYVVKL